MSCRNGPRLRWLALLGLVLLGVGWGHAAWAQISNPPAALVDTDINTTTAEMLKFPFLSVDLKQANMLANAFMFQMRLFTGATGQVSGGVATPGSLGGGFAAVRYLSLMAVMIGSILVLFFSKYRRPAVIIPWILLILISVFVPLNSKLLFYPIIMKLPQSLSNSGQWSYSLGVHDGRGCKDNPEGCGFTPQLVAAHLGSTLQMIVSDIFRSKQWTGLLERQAAATQLYQLPDFDMGPAWYANSVAFSKQCGSLPLRTLLPGATLTPSETEVMQTSISGKPYTTLEDIVKEYNTIYYGHESPDSDNAPPMAILPETTQMADDLGWDNDTRQSYLNKLSVMYRAKEFGSGWGIGDYDKKLVFENPQSGEITVTEALDNMDRLYSQSAGWAGQPFLKAIWSGSYTPLSMMFMRGAQVGTASANALDSRKCYVRTKTGIDVTGFNDPRGATNCANLAFSILPSKPLYGPSYHQEAFLDFYKAVYPTKDANQVSINKLGTPWAALAKIYSSDSGDVKDMPVGYGIPVFQSTSASPNLPGTVTSYGPVNVVTATAVPVCGETGKKLVNDAIMALTVDTNTGKQIVPYFDNLIKMLDGRTAAIPAVLSWEDIVADGVDINSYADKKNAMIWNMANFLNEEMRTASLRKNGQPIDNTDRREALMRGVLKLMDHVTPILHNMQGGAAAAADGDAKKPYVVGNQTLSGLGGMMASFITEKLTSVVAFFSGPLAVAFIYFVNILVDMVLLAIITMTPLLFVMGLVIPTSAAGVLMISIMAVFILKFVPVTMILLNALGGMMYDLLPVSFGPNADFALNLLIIAMSGMYMSVVGLTFFLMFKLGDPAAFLGRLVALDAASKKLADSGMDVVKAAAVAAVAVGAGAVGGGLGGAYQGLRSQLRGPVGNMADALEKRAKGMGGDGKDKDEAAEAGQEGLKVEAIKDGDINPATGLPFSDEERAAQDDVVPGLGDGDGPAIGDIAPDKTPYTSLRDRNGKLLSWGELGKMTSTSDPDLMLEDLREGHEQEFIGQDGKTYNARHNEDGGWTIEGAQLTAEGRSLAGAGGTSDEPLMDASQREKAQQNAVDAKNAAVDNRNVGQQPAGPAEPSRYEAAQGERTPQPGAAGSGAGGGDQGGRPVGTGQGAVETAAAAPQGGTQRPQSAREQIEATKAANRQQKTFQEAAEFTQRVAAQEEAIESEMKAVDTALASTTLSAGERTKLETKKEGLRGDKARLDKLVSDIDAAEHANSTIAEALGTLDNLEKARNLRLGADSLPRNRVEAVLGGTLKGLASGTFGSFSAVLGSGGGSIPFVGPAIREILNEFSQAPERARAVGAAGGIMKWMSLKGDANRLKYYNQEISPMVSGYQYQQMMGAGAAQAQFDVARQAASEAVARTRSQYLAINAAGGVKNAYGKDSLEGLGSMESAARLAAVRQEAASMQGATTTMRVAEIKDGKFTGQIKNVEVTMTPQLLAEMQGNIGVKAAAGRINEMLETHFPIAEKMYSRGGGWAKTQGMASDGAAARQYMMNDIDNDYVHGARLKMHSGKLGFFEAKATSQAIMQGLHNDEQVKLRAAQRVETIIQNQGGAQKAYEALIAANPVMKARYSVDSIVVGAAAPSEADFRKALVTMEADMSGEMRVKPMFDAATLKGQTEFLNKSLAAKVSTQFNNQLAEIGETYEKELITDMKRSGIPAMASKPVRLSTYDRRSQIDVESPIAEHFNAVQAALSKKGVAQEKVAAVASQLLKNLNDTLAADERRDLYRVERIETGEGKKKAKTAVQYAVDQSLIQKGIEKMRGDPNLSPDAKDVLDTLRDVGNEQGVFKYADAETKTESLLFKN